MRIVKSHDDLKLLEKAQVIGNDLANHLKGLLDAVAAELPELGEEGEYESYGMIVVLEAGDNPWDLSAVGLNKQDMGLVGTVPEKVEMHELDGIRYFQVLVIYNDSYGVEFFLALGDFDPSVDLWLQSYLEVDQAAALAEGCGLFDGEGERYS